MAVDTDFERSIYRHTQPVPAEDDLFTTFAERVQRRADEVIDGRNCKWAATNQARALLRILRSHPAGQAVPLTDLCLRLRLTPRELKSTVQDLRLNFIGQICASRDSDVGGYFLATTFDDVQAATLPMRRQAVSMLRVAKAMEGSHHDIEEMLGQIRLDLQKGPDDGNQRHS